MAKRWSNYVLNSLDHTRLMMVKLSLLCVGQPKMTLLKLVSHAMRHVFGGAQGNANGGDNLNDFRFNGQPPLMSKASGNMGSLSHAMSGGLGGMTSEALARLSFTS